MSWKADYYYYYYYYYELSKVPGATKSCTMQGYLCVFCRPPELVKCKLLQKIELGSTHGYCPDPSLAVPNLDTRESRMLENYVSVCTSFITTEN